MHQGCCIEEIALPDNVFMREHDSLGLPGCTAGVNQGGQVVLRRLPNGFLHISKRCFPSIKELGDHNAMAIQVRGLSTL